MTTAMLISGRGSLNGIAAQLNRPSIRTSYPQSRRTPGRAGRGIAGPRRRLVDDALEQLRLDRAIAHWRHGLARLHQRGVAGRVERRPSAAYLLQPRAEIAVRDGLYGEPPVGKAVAAEIRRNAGIFDHPGGEKVQIGCHAAPRVDLAREPRH